MVFPERVYFAISFKSNFTSGNTANDVIRPLMVSEYYGGIRVPNFDLSSAVWNWRCDPRGITGSIREIVFGSGVNRLNFPDPDTLIIRNNRLIAIIPP